MVRARCMNVTDDRQMTDHIAEKWVVIGEIACTKMISPSIVGNYNNNCAEFYSAL